MPAEKKTAGKQPQPMKDTVDINDGNASGYTPPEDGIGERIRQAREAKGFTQESLSRLTASRDPEGKGISRSVLAYYEKGKYKPGSRELRILFLALGVTPNWLILGKDDPERLRQFRELLGSEEAFFSALTTNLKELDSDSLNGIANLVFLAAANMPSQKAHNDKLVSRLNDFIDKAVVLEDRITALSSKTSPAKSSRKSKKSD